MSAAPDRFTTLAAASRFEPEKIKGSRFIACVSPASTADEARGFVDSVRAEFSDAGHVCFAWRLGAAGEVTRSGDDGEPSGSAGQALDRAELREVEVQVALRCVHPYGDSGPVQGVLAAWDVAARDEVYGEDVAFTVYVGVRAAEAFEAALRDATAARARVERLAGE